MSNKVYKVSDLFVKKAPKEHMGQQYRKKAIFWTLAYIFLLIAVGANIPAPLYSIYRQLWEFSSGVVTVIFAIYAFFLIPSLLIFGQISDHIGRKRVLISGISLAIIGAFLFSLANGLPWLFIARIVQGISAGMTNGVATAAFIDFNPYNDRKIASLVASVCMPLGIGLGPLMSGAIAEIASYPIVVPYVIYVLLMIPGFIALVIMWKTNPSKTLEPLRIRRFRTPVLIRQQFMISCLIEVLCWSSVALYMSVIPAYISKLADVQNLALTGMVTFIVFIFSSSVQLILRRIYPQKSISIGVILLTLGLILLIVAITVRSLPLLIISAIINGAGHGLSFMGSMALINLVSPSEKRGDVISNLYVWAYIGLGIPVVGVGLLAEAFGLYMTLSIFTICFIIISIFSVILILTKPQLSRTLFPKTEYYKK